MPVKDVKSAMPRKGRLVLLLNAKELEVLNRYLLRHRISNRSGFVRQVLMRHLLHALEEESPRLF